MRENPELDVHPLWLKPDRCGNPHFKLEETAHEEGVGASASQYDLGTLHSEGGLAEEHVAATLRR